MARITVFIPDEVLHAADLRYLEVGEGRPVGVNRSRMVTEALGAWADAPARPDVSERGRLETLRSLRAARAALDELEQGLTQARPVHRRVRRYRAGSRGHSGA